MKIAFLILIVATTAAASAETASGRRSLPRSIANIRLGSTAQKISKSPERSPEWDCIKRKDDLAGTNFKNTTCDVSDDGTIWSIGVLYQSGNTTFDDFVSALTKKYGKPKAMISSANEATCNPMLGADYAMIKDRVITAKCAVWEEAGRMMTLGSSTVTGTMWSGDTISLEYISVQLVDKSLRDREANQKRRKGQAEAERLLER